MRLVNFMIKLRNIKKNNNVLECDIFPEDCKDKGHLIIEINSEKVVTCELPEGYEWCTNHIAHAKYKLLEMAKDGFIPKEKLIMWY